MSDDPVLMLGGKPATFNGLKIVIDKNLSLTREEPDPTPEDPTRTKTVQILGFKFPDGVFLMHPDRFALLEAAIAKANAKR